MNNIASLQPKAVWSFFDEILKIPRPSKKEEKILNYLVEFAKARKLEYQQDNIGNLIIRKPASKGFENLKTVILQSHVDMVCEKNSDVEHDFEHDPINAYIDDNWVKARGTTLGADNGIGIAAQLAILDDNTLEHGPVECLFTIDEETALTGAFNLGSDLISGDILLNLDSEDDGELFIGCAGGIDTVIDFKYESDKFPKDYSAYKVSISGLKGGHSGDDIEKNRENSNKLLARILWNASQKFNLNIAEFRGGNLRNAIPREAFVIFGISKNEVQAFKDFLKKYSEILKGEHSIAEPGLKVIIEDIERPEQVMKKKSQQDFLNALMTCPNGVIEMSPSIPGLVRTSSNLASVRFNPENMIQIITSQRSSVESSKDNIANRIRSTFELIRAEVKHEDSYPGWQPNTNSPILKITKNVHSKVLNEEPKIRAIHAGLECGLFLQKYPYLDMISFGPTIADAHSPDERLYIPAVKKFWKLLLGILKEIPKKNVIE